MELALTKNAAKQNAYTDLPTLSNVTKRILKDNTFLYMKPGNDF